MSEVKTLAGVGRVREYDTRHGRKAAITLVFQDGEEAELTTNADKVGDRVEMLTTLVDQPREFELTDQPPWPSGDARPRKVVNYPGKPGPNVVASNDRPARGKSPEEQQAIARMAALKAAVEYTVAGDLGPATDDDVLKRAEKFFNWIVAGAGSGGGPRGSELNTDAPAPATQQVPGVPLSAGRDGGASPSVDAGPSAPPSHLRSADSFEKSPDDGHEHDWQPAPNPDAAARGFETCSLCGLGRRK